MTKLESFKLMTLIQGAYEQRAERDTDFAKFATQTLGFPITTAKVRAARVGLGIANTGDKPAGPPRELLIRAVAAIRSLAGSRGAQASAEEWDTADELEKFL